MGVHANELFAFLYGRGDWLSDVLWSSEKINIYVAVDSFKIMNGRAGIKVYAISSFV